MEIEAGILRDEKTLQYYGIEDEDIIIATYEVRAG
jgi:hypothetical protein